MTILVRMVMMVRLSPVRVTVPLGPFFPAHLELGGRHTGPGDSLGPDRVSIDRQAAQRTAQVIERQAGIEQRPQDHVARGTARTIEVDDPHRQRPGSADLGHQPVDLADRKSTRLNSSHRT